MCIHLPDRRAVFRYETNDTSEGMWYFYLDDNWPAAVVETECSKKIEMARFASRMAMNMDDKINSLLIYINVFQP